MKFFRFFSIFICCAVLFFLFACNNTADSGELDFIENTESPASSPDSSGGAVSSLDYDSAFAAFPSDTVMITAGDYEIHWDELFFFLCNSVSYISDSFEGEPDFTAEFYDGQTYAEAILSYASEDALSYKAVNFGAELLGVSLTPDDYEAIQSDYDAAVSELGSEEELLKRLREYSHIYSRELFDYFLVMEYLTSLCYQNMFGENGNLVSDESVAEYVENDGYLMAKHILRLKNDGDTDVSEKAYAEAQEILDKLNSYTGGDFSAYFTGLMFEYSQDTGGLASFPNGYLFQYGNMVSEFYEGTLALEIGGYSDIIETTYGYHIIYRLPVSFDAVPYSYAREGYSSTLRQITASNLFNSAVYEWTDSLDITYTDAYNSINIQDIFKPVQ